MTEIKSFDEHSMLGHIKVYRTIPKKLDIFTKKSVNLLKRSIKRKILVDPQPTILVLCGKFENVQFNEELDEKKFKTPRGNIEKIGCNFWEKENPDVVPPPKKERKSNKGRKPKLRRKSARKMQGTGKYFASNIGINIRNTRNNIVYKIKLFRNGRVIIPGVTNVNLADIVEPIEELEIYLSKVFGKPVKMSYMTPVLLNYKTNLIDNNLKIDLSELYKVLLEERKNQNGPRAMYAKKVFRSVTDKAGIPRKISDIIAAYADIVPKDMAEVNFNPERYFGITAKFHRPMPANKDKKMTIKLLRSGKVNFDGGNSEIEILELFYWLTFIYNKHYERVIYNVSKDEIDISDCSDESIYDYMLDENNEEEDASDTDSISSADENLLAIMDKCGEKSSVVPPQ